jgi:hypothetical protein
MEDLENYVEKSNETMGALSSTEFVDRIARAIDAHLSNIGHGLNNISLGKSIAYVALRAMREPSDQMVEAFYMVEWHMEPVSATEGWQAMIDEALK